MILRALIETVDDPARAPRSLTIHYTRAPEPGPVQIRTVRERDGRSLSTLSARMEQDGRLIALVLAAFSVPWSGPEISDLRDARRWSRRGEPVWPGKPPHPLAAADRRATRPAAALRRTAVRPARSSAMEIGGWLGHRDGARDRRALARLLQRRADPGAVHAPRRAEPRADDRPQRALPRRGFAAARRGEPLELCLIRIRTGLIHEGFFEEDGLIWAPDGTLLAQSRQLALLLPIEVGSADG